MSIMEVLVSSITDKFGFNRRKTLTTITLVGFGVSLIFVTGAGLYILDIVDHFVNTYAIAISGLVEIIFIAWFFDLEEVRQYANSMSDFAVGSWWNFTLKYMTPVLLSVMFAFNAFNDFTKGYEGYSIKALSVYGGGTLLIILLFSIYLKSIRGNLTHENQMGKGVKML